MGAVPNHPFFLTVIDSLPEYNRNWVLPYITVMGTTGPLFLSVIWRHYSSAGPTDNQRVRILFPDEYNNHPWSFFVHHRGNSWHGKDVQLIFWMNRHWLVLTVAGFIVGFSAIFGIWWIYGRVVLTHRYRSRSSAPSGSPVSLLLRPGASLWRRLGAAVFALASSSADGVRGKDDSDKPVYELVDRHEV